MSIFHRLKERVNQKIAPNAVTFDDINSLKNCFEDDEEKSEQVPVVKKGLKKIVENERRQVDALQEDKENVGLATEARLPEKNIEPMKYTPPEVRVKNEMTVDTLFSKIRHNHYEIVEAALQSGFDPMSVDGNGNTMLHIVAQNNHKKLAQLVIHHGCPLSVRNRKGFTPLDFCRMYKFDNLFAWLEARGCVLGEPSP